MHVCVRERCKDDVSVCKRDVACHAVNHMTQLTHNTAYTYQAAFTPFIVCIYTHTLSLSITLTHSLTNSLSLSLSLSLSCVCV